MARLTVLQRKAPQIVSAWQKAKCEAITIQIGSHCYMAGMEYGGDSKSRNGFLSHQSGPLVGALDQGGPPLVGTLDGPIILLTSSYAALPFLGFNHPWLQ